MTNDEWRNRYRGALIAFGMDDDRAYYFASIREDKECEGNPIEEARRVNTDAIIES